VGDIARLSLNRNFQGTASAIRPGKAASQEGAKNLTRHGRNQITKLQTSLTTDYTDSTDKNQQTHR